MLDKNHNGVAGIKICITPDDKTEPFNLTLYLKKPKECESELSDNSLTTTGKLIFKFGKRGSVELFAENTRQIGVAVSEAEEGI